MSKENYKKGIECIENNKESIFIGKGASNSFVDEAEKLLGVKFSFEYKDFLMRYGSLTFDGGEIYGITSDGFLNSGIPNGVWYTLKQRETCHLPNHLLIIYNTESDEYFCLDFSKLNEEGEPQVVAYAHCVDVEYQTYEKISDDFGDFLLELLKRSEIYKEDNSNE